jgi:hypothetical protein
MQKNDDFAPPASTIPFAWWHSILIGAMYGFMMRLIFNSSVGFPGNYIDALGTMTTAFAVFVPIAIGAITVHLAEKQRRRSFSYYFFAPWLSVTLFVAGTAIALIEGAICIALALPLFVLGGSIGGIIMGIISRQFKKTTHTTLSIAVLPFLVALGEMGQPIPHLIETTHQQIYINASPTAVWQQINTVTAIKPNELETGVAYSIGVPYPIEVKTVSTGVGGKRHLVWQRGVSFDQEITDWKENQTIAWKYLFTNTSFPKGSMDDHVAIGGQYFNLETSRYTLTPYGHGTQLDVQITFSVSTHFNWYAKPWANLLVKNTAAVILSFHKKRVEAADSKV